MGIRQPIACTPRSIVTAVAIALLVAGCSTDDASIYRVVGGGTSCDADACPPGTPTYSLRLAEPGAPPADARSFDLGENAPGLDDVGEYPDCVLAEIVGTEVESWEPASCP
jgi:hypothetical protein